MLMALALLKSKFALTQIGIRYSHTISCTVFVFAFSDDDLVAYDMSSDPKVSSVKTPRHLRTCLQGTCITVL